MIGPILALSLRAPGCLGHTGAQGFIHTLKLVSLLVLNRDHSDDKKRAALQQELLDADRSDARIMAEALANVPESERANLGSHMALYELNHFLAKSGALGQALSHNDIPSTGMGLSSPGAALTGYDGTYPAGVQMKEQAGAEKKKKKSDWVRQMPSRGAQGGGFAPPHLDKQQQAFGAHGDWIQSCFGKHDISGVEAHTDGKAAKAAGDIGAKAYASGNKIAFKGSPDRHTAAHEAAHVVQQRGGVQLKGGVGQAGDKYEAHADAVADLVVQGKSAEGLLNQMSGTGKTAGQNIQRQQGVMGPIAPSWLQKTEAIKIHLLPRQTSDSHELTEIWRNAAVENFSHGDQNNDALMSGQETNNLLLNPNVEGDHAAAIAATHQYFEQLIDLSDDNGIEPDDELSRKDIDGVSEKSGVISRFWQARRNIANANCARRHDEIWGNTETTNELFPNGKPHLDALRQGALGDCFFLAPLGSLIAKDPMAIVEMIERNTDENDQPLSYTVSFPGFDAPITVNVPTDGEIARYSTSGQDGLWLAVLEKAYGEKRAGASDANRQESIGEGGRPDQGMAPFTKAGTQMDYMSNGPNKETTAQNLTEAFEEGRLVTASIHKKNSLGLPTFHGYSVIGWDGTWLTLRNPWGYNPREVPQQWDETRLRVRGSSAQSADSEVSKEDETQIEGFKLVDTNGRFKMTLDCAYDILSRINYEKAD